MVLQPVCGFRSPFYPARPDPTRPDRAGSVSEDGEVMKFHVKRLSIDTQNRDGYQYYGNWEGKKTARFR